MACFKGKSRCERDRYNKLLNEKRKEYPLAPYDFDSWKRKSSAQRINECKQLGIATEKLRLLKESSNIDVGLSDGYRVDERHRAVYTTLYNEHNRRMTQQYCNDIIDHKTQQDDAVRLQQEADIIQARIEENTEKQRTLIIAVGGVVLLLGTVFILRKL